MSGTKTFDREIRERFPQPIAVAWHRVHLASHASERIDALSNFSELLLRTLTALVLPDYLRGEPHPETEAVIERLSRPSMGVLLQLYRRTCRTLLGRDDTFCPEAVLYGAQDDETGPRELDALVALRNQAAHESLPSANREELAQVFTTRAREALSALPWMSRYRWLQMLDERSTREGTTRGKIQFFVGRDAIPEPVSVVWSASLVRDTVYVVSPDGRNLLDLYPFVLMQKVEGANQEHLHVWKHIRNLSALSLYDDDTGHSVQLRPQLRGQPVSFRRWLSERKNLPNPVLQEDLAVSVFHCPASRIVENLHRIVDERYEIKDVLGEGGMATVYRAIDHEQQHECALKVMRRSLLFDSEFHERFKREVRALRSLHHSRIVSVEDAFSLQDGRLCIRMPVLTGGSLADRVRAGGASKERVIKWAEQALEGLAYLHENGFVHRDIKPSNLLLDGQDDLVVADFGVVFHASDPRVTRTLEQVGTTAYLAPEQRRQSAPPSEKSDLYSLALVLHEVLTGDERVLHPGQGMQDGFGAWLKALAHENPDARPTATDALRRLREEGGDLWNIIPSPAPLDSAAQTKAETSQEPNAPNAPPSPASKAHGPKRGLVMSACAFLIAIGLGYFALQKTSASCGDGIVTPPEECDDGNLVAGDLCTETCTSNVATLPAGAFWFGYRKSELEEKMHLVTPSRRSDSYLLTRAQDATPATPVLMRSFRLMKTEVSQGAFADFISSPGYGKLETSPRSKEAVTWHKSLLDDVRAAHQSRMEEWKTRPELPVQVPLPAAVAYCAFMGGALPSESQWEYAAKGSESGRIFPWGSAPLHEGPQACERYAGFFAMSLDPPKAMDCSQRRRAKVGAKKAGCTPEGICDMAGNADEFVHPGPVIWKEEEVEGQRRWVARLPGPKTSTSNSMEFLWPCDRKTYEDPFGLRSGTIEDCSSAVGESLNQKSASHARDSMLLPVRGGNFDDSLPIYYQTRARYPYLDPNRFHKGIRCAFQSTPY